MHFYCLRATKNYKDAFQLIYTTKIKHFSCCLYFYCVNNGINPLTVVIDLSKVSFIIAERQSYIELPKELWDRTKQMERHKRAILSKSCQSNSFYTTQPGRQEQSYLTKTKSLYLLFWVYGKGKEYIQLPAVPLF